MAAMQHDPVMREEVLAMLQLKPGMAVCDGTLGLGGHSVEMWAQVQPGGALLGLDWDRSMLAEAESRVPGAARVYADYRALPLALEGLACGERSGEAWECVGGDWPRGVDRLDAILLDLGLNSAQLDDPERGISFQDDGPLDMRMDRGRGEPASAFLNRASESLLEKVIREWGEERFARRIATAIVDRRRAEPIRTTGDLVGCVLAAIPPALREKRIHPATRTFQAIRIHVNAEIDGLQEAIESIARCLAPGGRLVVLSYHSLEDRAVKHAFRQLDGDGFEALLRKPQVPTATEIARNRRARSAKMRAIERRNSHPGTRS